MSLLRAAFALPVLLLAVACGEDESSDAGADERSDEPTRLVVTRADGSDIVFDEVTARCAPSSNDEKTEVVQVQGTANGAILTAELVPGDVEHGRTFDLPISAGDQESGVDNLDLFVGEKSGLEISTSEEESTGSLEVLRASCDPVEVELTVDGTLGSEYFDGETARVEGRLVFPAPAG